MILEFESPNPFGILAAIAAATGTVVDDGTINIPAEFGKGFIKSIVVNQQLMLLIRQYELKEELIVKRGLTDDGDNLIIMAFHNLYRTPDMLRNNTFSMPSVQITTAGTDYEDFFPSNSHVNTFIILIHISLLKDLLDSNQKSEFLQVILSGKRSFFFEEVISPEMQHIADEILSKKVSLELRDFFYRIKTEQLIYLCLNELGKRERLSEYPPNVNDVRIIYAIRNKMMADLSDNPNLSVLAKTTGMSESKIKRLFKQIFGNSIYNYYQSLRIEQAAFLIKEHNLSISEAGYLVGFTNLSHFARIFERHKGVKPKKYAKIG